MSRSLSWQPSSGRQSVRTRPWSLCNLASSSSTSGTRPEGRERALPDHLGVERVSADHTARDVANGVGRPALADAGDPGVGIDEHDHVALRKRLRAVRVVVGRIEDADLRDLRRREPRGGTSQTGRRRLRGCAGEPSGRGREKAQRTADRLRECSAIQDHRLNPFHTHSNASGIVCSCTRRSTCPAASEKTN